jgi:hypothetical protein
LCRHPRQRFGTVDEDLERVSRARLRLSGGPAARGGIERREPTGTAQPPPVMRADSVADRRSQLAISAERETASQGSRSSHSGSPSSSTAL